MEKSGFQKNFDLHFFRSESFLIRTYQGNAPAFEVVLLRGGLPSDIALQGGSLEFKIVYRGVGADLEKPKICFRQQGPDNPPPQHPTWTPGCKRNLCSMEENRILLRTVALVLLFITLYYYDTDCCLVKTIR